MDLVLKGCSYKGGGYYKHVEVAVGRRGRWWQLLMQVQMVRELLK